MKILQRIGQPLVVLVIVGFSLLLGMLGTCTVATRFDPDPATMGWATQVGAGVGLVLGIAAVVYYYRRR
jgi:hypothetical protein